MLRTDWRRLGPCWQYFKAHETKQRSRSVQRGTPNGGRTPGIVQNRRPRPKTQRKRLPRTPNFLRFRYWMTMGTLYNPYLTTAENSPKDDGKRWIAKKRKRSKRKSADAGRHRTQIGRPLNNWAKWCWLCSKAARRSRTCYRRYGWLTPLTTISISEMWQSQRTAPYWYAPEETEALRETLVDVSGRFWGHQGTVKDMTRR